MHKKCILVTNSKLLHIISGFLERLLVTRNNNFIWGIGENGKRGRPW